MAGQIRYSQEELDFIESHKKLPRRELTALFNRTYRRVIDIDNIKGLCTRKGWQTGQTGRFQKGHIPHPRAYRKGPGRTRYKKGQVPPNTKKLWHERINVYGYIEIKVPEENPYTKCKTRYYYKHRWNWEKVHGPIPKGSCLICLDGNKLNCDEKNWVLVNRQELLYLNKLRYYEQPEEARPAVLTLARLMSKTFRKERNEKP